MPFATRRVLAAVTAALAGATPAAFAQQTQKVEKIEVTGSNIKRLDAETVSPVTIITKTDIERSGAQTIAEVLRNIPQNAGASFNETFTNSFAPGAAGLSLRGLGQKSTLVLINGRRIAGYGFAQNIFDTFVDINSIPVNAVERVEILKDGASAVYGSDAIAGVVNVILRQDFRGVEASGSFGTSDEGGMDETRASIAVGYGDMATQKFNVIGAFEYFKRDQLLASERRTTQGQDFRDQPGGTLAWATLGAYVRTGTSRAPFASCPPENLVPANQLNSILTGTSCAYNPSSYLPLFPESERKAFVGRGTLEISPSLTAFAELNFSNNQTFQTFTPAQVATANITFDPATGGVRNIPGTLPANNPSNPFGVPTPFIYTFFDVGPRDTTIESDSYRLLAGLKGNFGRWDWEGALGTSRTETSSVNYNRVNANVVQQMIANGTYNFLNPSAGTVTANDLRINPTRDAESELEFADFKVSTELLQMAAGPLGFAAGVDFRRESLEDKPDPLLTNGSVLGQGFTRTTGERDATAAYFEFSIPLLKQVEAQVAARYDRYSDFGSATSPKVGLRWTPLKSLLLRGSYSEGFRAPTLPEASESNAISFITVRDPNFNNAQFNIGRLSTSNPALEAEDSENYNLGFVWEPNTTVSFSMDWYRIRQNKLIGRDSPQFIINQAAAGDPMWVNNVIRDPNTGFIIYIVNPVRNREFVETEGVDAELRLRFNLADYGKVNWNTTVNYTTTFESVTAAGQPVVDFVDSNGFFTNPRFRGVSSLSWLYGPWTSTLTYRYVHSYDQALVTAQSRVGRYADADLYVSYEGFKNLKLFGSIRNIHDTDRPWDASSTNGLDFQVHDLRGRYFTVGLNYSFR